MKVVYDVSMLGCPHLQASARTGIFRVVESLAVALARSSKCALSFSATDETLHYYALRELAQHAQLRGVPVLHSGRDFYFFSKRHAAQQRVTETGGVARLGWRAWRKLIRHANDLAKRFPVKDRLQQEQAGLREADIFHSPFHAIPATVRNEKRLRVFLTVHDLIPILYPQYFEAAGGDYLKQIVDGIGKDDWITCVSHQTKEDLCNYRRDLDPGRVAVTHLGASEWFHPCDDAGKIEAARAKCEIPPGDYILSVGTLEPRKNLAHLIRAFLQLIRQQRLGNHYLVLVGSFGWKYESILAELTAADPGLRERIILAGRVEDQDMAVLYSGCAAFVYPSLYEGFGLPPLEAMQCGAPVIVSNTSSLPEVVGEAGMLVEPTDADALCQAMLRLFTDSALRQTMSQKSIEQARQFSWERCAGETLNFYQTALAAK